jgi:hypothetical protein
MVDEHEETARKSPRMRFTSRRMMVGVAIVAVIMVVSKTLFIDNQPTDFLFVALSLLDGSQSVLPLSAGGSLGTAVSRAASACKSPPWTNSKPNRPLMQRWPWVTSTSRGEVTFTIRLS